MGLLVAVALWIVSTAAMAQSDARSRAAVPFQQGMEAYTEGQFGDAARHLTEAYALDPNPRLAFNVGRSWERFGNDTMALEFFRLAAGSTQEAQVRQLSLEAIARLEARDAPQSATVQEGQGTARLLVMPQDASRSDRLRIENANRSVELPARVRLPTGVWVITVTNDEGEPLRSWRLDLEPGMTILLRYAIDTPSDESLWGEEGS